jgi:DNA modification methylase
MSAPRKEVLAEGVECWLGDCREILPTLGRFDAVVTDPPYGIGINKSNRLSVSRGHGGETWDEKPADMAWLPPLGKPAIVWGGNYFGLPPTRAPLVWDKNNAGRDFADFELAWTNLDMVARRIIMRPINMDGGKLHPTQKPIEVMRWCIGYLPEDAQTILDPYMGSGTTGVAAVSLGRKFTGVEIEPKYHSIACRRISEKLKQPDMFVESPKPAKQEALEL